MGTPQCKPRSIGLAARRGDVTLRGARFTPAEPIRIFSEARELPKHLREFLLGRSFWLLPAAVAAAGVLPQLASPAVPDLSWLLYVAGRMLDGARLGVDLVEINPPLIVWLNLPPALLARWTGLPDIQVYRLGVVALALLSLAATAALLRRESPDRPPLEHRLLLLLLTFVLLGLPLADLGQREHLLLLAVLPYIVATALRARQRALPLRHALLIGAAAGAGIALKPYFLLLPLALEAWLLGSARTRGLRPETFAALAVPALYLGAVALLTPEYLQLVRSLGPWYLGYLRDPILLTAVAGDGAGVALLALLAAWVLHSRLEGDPAAKALLVATAALYLGAVLQQKGWRYYFYPSMGTGLLLLLLLVRRAAGTGLTLAGRVYAAAAVATLLYLPVATALAGLGELARPRLARFAADPDLPRLAGAVRAAAPGGGLYVLSINMASAFPLVRETGARWTSRLPCLWLLESLYREQLADAAPLVYRPPERQPPAERYLNRVVVEDLRRGRPDLIVELRPAPDRFEWGTRRLDYAAYFGRDPEFAAEFARYRPIADVGEYRLYGRAANAVTPPAAAEPALAPPLTALAPGVHVAPLRGRDLAAAALFLGVFALAFRRLRRGRAS